MHFSRSRSSALFAEQDRKARLTHEPALTPTGAIPGQRPRYDFQSGEIIVQ